jgi:hypothetical protein
MMDPRTSTVLKAMAEGGVQCLLTGGQACVIYGAAEFSKDVDFVVLADTDNFSRIESVARRLDAEIIAVPTMRKSHLDEGLAIHLRCRLPAIADFRIDLMSRMRGVSPFPELWDRRTTFRSGELEIHVMGVRDLVQSKKTQRAKDWPMIQRLLEVHYLQRRHADQPSGDDVDLWLREMRTVELIAEVAGRFKADALQIVSSRPLLLPAMEGDLDQLRNGLESGDRS